MDLQHENALPQGVAGAPNKAALLALIEKSGYTMRQEYGQRKYGGPPPEWDGPSPGRGCEIFIGKIPRDCYEDELVPVFEKIGTLYEFRLMMDFSGSNRGYAFAMYTLQQDASHAIKKLNDFEIREGCRLGVCRSVQNCRLFLSGIPKSKQRDEILDAIRKVTEDVVDVIVYPNPADKTKTRGFAFVEYDGHRAAAMARYKLLAGLFELWGHQIIVDWAEPEIPVDEEIMSTVNNLHVRNLMLNTTEKTIKQTFEKAIGKENVIERVKKLSDYAFVHFETRDDALQAMKMMNGATLEGSTIEVVLAKPMDKTNYRYIRKARGGQGYKKVRGYSSLVTPLESPVFSGQFIPQPGAGRVTSTANGLHRQLRGSSQGAAGARGAEGSRGYRIHPVDVLENLCQKNAWGRPLYQLHSSDGGVLEFFNFKITIPALASHNLPPFQTDVMFRTVEDAKTFAASLFLLQLGVNWKNAKVPSAFAATQYQGRPIYPNSGCDLQSFPSALPIASSASYVTPGKFIQNPGYPGTYQYQDGYAAPPPFSSRHVWQRVLVKQPTD